MRVFVLLNQSARTAKGSDQEECVRKVEDAFAKRGAVAVIKTVHGSEITGAVQDYLQRQACDPSTGYDVLVVGGGDGTIGAASGVLIGNSEPFGILALGTLNHFAKDLSIPLELEAAVEVILQGKSRLIDAGELNGRIFINNSSVGLYPFMVASRIAEQNRRGFGKLVASIPAIARTLFKGTWHRFYIRFENRKLSFRTPCIFVGNNMYDLGLERFGSRSRLDLGELSVFVINLQTKLALLLLPFRVALGITNRSRDIEVFKTDAVEVASRLRRLRVSLDGEVKMIETPLRYSIKRRALCVLAPVEDNRINEAEN